MKATLDPRSFTIATFALCGFANFSSIGIQIGGIGALAPNKQSELARLGIRAMLAGTMANLMSASHRGDVAAMSCARARKAKPTGEFARADARCEIHSFENETAPENRAGARQRPGRFRGRTRQRHEHSLREDSRLSALHRHRPCRAARDRQSRRRAVAAMQGRVHLYEGYSQQEVIFPMRVFGRMGIRAVMLTNAAGGINLDLQPGRAGA